ncbi:sigma-70 family RNA polymerase sigma factor [Polyangium aurulentum]|uniref:sigma-70 family RNA polymerase sigma factor n=1 Tax=Polyangium aurulentum TaxID=2567896 RepID=UPI0010ADEA4D|nr:sigma-70 family RNA polymerase sigma factor [Polyangium aurulentum]UQA61826.1 sigma-70 family RNA polymerase sigma factor [Polyangium aurulentum]
MNAGVRYRGAQWTVRDRALSKLDAVEREILVRYHVAGETCDELGGGLGLTRSGAHARLQPAEARMRAVVRRYG